MRSRRSGLIGSTSTSHGPLDFSEDPVAWNDLEITAKATRIHIILNGITVADNEGAGVLDEPVHNELQEL